MAKGGNVGAVVILGILAVAGLGLSGYMFINDQFFGEDEDTHEGYKLVAVWDELYGSGTAFNVSFNDIQLNESEYFSMNNINESVTLTQEGWYRFTIITTMTSLDSGNNYYFRVENNGVIVAFPIYFGLPSDSYMGVNLVYYAYSDGNDIFNFHWHSSIADAFQVASNQQYNQATLEYVG